MHIQRVVSPATPFKRLPGNIILLKYRILENQKTLKIRKPFFSGKAFDSPSAPAAVGTSKRSHTRQISIEADSVTCLSKAKMKFLSINYTTLSVELQILPKLSEFTQDKAYGGILCIVSSAPYEILNGLCLDI